MAMHLGTQAQYECAQDISRSMSGEVPDFDIQLDELLVENDEERGERGKRGDVFDTFNDDPYIAVTAKNTPASPVRGLSPARPGAVLVLPD